MYILIKFKSCNILIICLHFWCYSEINVIFPEKNLSFVTKDKIYTISTYIVFITSFWCKIYVHNTRKRNILVNFGYIKPRQSKVAKPRFTASKDFFVLTGSVTSFQNFCMPVIGIKLTWPKQAASYNLALNITSWNICFIYTTHNLGKAATSRSF